MKKENSPLSPVNTPLSGNHSKELYVITIILIIIATVYKVFAAW